MLNLRKYVWIYVLIAAILSILTAFVPMSVINDGIGDKIFFWMFGLFLRFDNFKFHSAGFEDLLFSLIGALFVLLLIIFGILLLVSAISQMKGKESKLQNKWMGFGIFFLLMPFIFRITMLIIGFISPSFYYPILLGTYFYSVELLTPIIAFLLLLSGALKQSR